jgi:serine/threonine protein kinase
MGVVYKAQDLMLGRTVALKFLPPWERGNLNARERLIREARYASTVNHPNIVTVHEVKKIEGVNFIVMEYVDGRTLARLITTDGLHKKAQDYAFQLADALATIHFAGFLHGDLKPRNIMVNREGKLKLLDFGLARALTQRRRRGDADLPHRFGTLLYMAPELIRDRRAAPDPRSEIFSFGLILHQMLSGAHAFGQGRSNEVAAAILSDDPKALPPKVPVRLAAIVARCLQKDIEARFQSMGDVLRELRKLCACRRETRCTHSQRLQLLKRHVHSGRLTVPCIRVR